MMSRFDERDHCLVAIQEEDSVDVENNTPTTYPILSRSLKSVVIQEGNQHLIEDPAQDEILFFDKQNACRTKECFCSTNAESIQKPMTKLSLVSPFSSTSLSSSSLSSTSLSSSSSIALSSHSISSSSYPSNEKRFFDSSGSSLDNLPPRPNSTNSNPSHQHHHHFAHHHHHGHHHGHYLHRHHNLNDGRNNKHRHHSNNNNNNNSRSNFPRRNFLSNVSTPHSRLSKVNSTSTNKKTDLNTLKNKTEVNSSTTTKIKTDSSKLKHSSASSPLTTSSSPITTSSSPLTTSSSPITTSSSPITKSSSPITKSSPPITKSSLEEGDKSAKLNNLKLLFDRGFINNAEFQERKSQLDGEILVMTPTNVVSKWSQPPNSLNVKKIVESIPIITPRPPPDFLKLESEEAIKHMFNYTSRKWTTYNIKIKLDKSPFAKGGLRMVYHLQDLSRQSDALSKGSYVAKMAIDPNEDDETYFRDVEMQAHAAYYANRFNTYNPPRKIEFVQAWILQLKERGNLLCGMEPYIPGNYQKHNNNCGYVSELERNTPQAFSHFTLEASNREILIVDIQGVGDRYTDPQIHTRRGEEFGKGNLSLRGFERFIESHRCNPICRYLKLKEINPKEMYGTSQGTVPAQTYMSKPSIEAVTSDIRHYYGNSNAYRKHARQRRVGASPLHENAPRECTCGYGCLIQ